MKFENPHVDLSGSQYFQLVELYACATIGAWTSCT